jgi:hypothetical protein
VGAASESRRRALAHENAPAHTKVFTQRSLSPTEKFPPTAKAPDAGTLDGIDSTQFLHGYVNGTSANSTVSVPAGLQATADSWCPEGTRPLGGGYFPFTAGGSALRTVTASFAVNDVTGAPGFQVTMANEGAAAETFHVNVRCANAP